MAQVPYSGAPQVSPSNQGIGGVSSEAPADAFGVGIARELGGLGDAISKAGDIVFARGLAMQELANQSAAREADANYIIEVGKLQAEFNSLEGPTAIHALPKYQQDIDNLRTSISKSLNPMAKRMFDSSARQTMARTIFNGASHAATQNRKWAKETLAAQLDLSTKTVEDDPQNDNLFKQKQAQVASDVSQLVALQGLDLDSPQAQKLLLERQSALWSSRILGLSRTDPEGAGKMLQANKTSLTQNDYLRLDNSVRQQARAIGAANIAQEVYDPTKSVEEMQAAAEKRAKAAFPDDPIGQKNVITNLKGFIQNQQAITRNQRFADNQIIAQAVQGGVKTLQELLADPAYRAAYDRLPASEQNKVPAAINKYQRDVNAFEAGELDTRLKGLSSTDVEAYLDTAILDQNLTKAQKDWHLERQRKLKEKATSDPRVFRAVNLLRGPMGAQLQALGVYSRTKDNMAQYDQFVGTLQDALDTWQEEHKRRPTDKEIVEVIGPQVVQTRSYPGRLWGKNEYPIFDPPTYTEEYTNFAEKIKADVVARGGKEPTPEQVLRAYNRMQYIKLYGKSQQKDQSRP